MSKAMIPKPFLALAIKRAALYFLGLDFITLFYYVVGNSQAFLLSTQLMLLALVSLLSSAALVSGFAGLISTITFWVRGRGRLSPSAVVGWAACMVISGALGFISSAVRVFAAGA